MSGKQPGYDDIGAIYLDMAAACEGIKDLERRIDAVFSKWIQVQDKAYREGINFTLSMSEPVVTALAAYKKQIDKTKNREWRNSSIRDEAEAAVESARAAANSGD